VNGSSIFSTPRLFRLCSGCEEIYAARVVVDLRPKSRKIEEENNQ